MFKLDNTKIKKGDTVLVKLNSFSSWSGDHRAFFREEKVTKVNSSSVYTDYQGSKTRYPLKKTKPLVVRDFLDKKTLYRNKEEYAAYTKQQNDNTVLWSLDLMNGYILDITSLYNRLKEDPTVSAKYLGEVNAALHKALLIEDESKEAQRK